jgi:hypothetical protein
MKRLAIAVVTLMMSACAGEETGPTTATPAPLEPEIVHRPRGTIIALAKQGSRIVVVHERGIDRVDTTNGAIERLAGIEYLACPDPVTGGLEPLRSASNVAVVDDTLVISLTECKWALWTFDLSGGGARRELAPLAPDGEWPGMGEIPLDITAHEGRIFAAVSSPIPEIWSFDPKGGRREKIAAFPHEMRSCNAPLVDDSAVYVTCADSSSFSALYRIDRATREVAAMAPLGLPIDLAQDDDALYVSNAFGPGHRVEKTARWNGGSSPATKIDWPAKMVGAIAVVENGTLFGAGSFDGDPTEDPMVIDGLWSLSPNAPSRELATFRQRDDRFRSLGRRALVTTERALFASAFNPDTGDSVLMRIPR